MTAMIDSTLDYMRGLEDNEPVQPIDVDALLQSLVDDAAVLGRPIGIEGKAGAPSRTTERPAAIAPGASSTTPSAMVTARAFA